MTNIKVSIIIPVYNIENRVLTCLESLKGLTLDGVEFILINDGSTDHTEKVVKEFINNSNDFRFKLFSKKNEGPGAARNFGIERALGDYIWFIDGDDKIEQGEFLEKAVNYAEKNNLDLLEFNFDAQKKNSLVKSPVKNTSKIVTGIDLFYSEMQKSSSFWLTVWHFLIKRTFIQENQFKFSNSSYAEDTLWSLKLIIKAKRAAFLDKVGYFYQYYPNTISHNLNNLHKTSRDTIEAVDDIFKFIQNIPKNNDHMAVLRGFIAKLYIGAVVQLSAIDKNFELDKNQLENVCRGSKLTRNDRVKKLVLKYMPLNLRRKICRKIIQKFLDVNEEDI